MTNRNTLHQNSPRKSNRGLSPIREAYINQKGKRILFLIGSLCCIILLIGYATILGSANLTIIEVYSAILGKIFPWVFSGGELSNAIIWEIRLPRIVMAIIAGAGLALAGAVMQGVLQNPLAEPFTLGISSAAASGAAIAIVTGAGLIGGPFLIIGNAFVFAMAATALVYLLAQCRGMTPESMILSGIAIMFFLNAITSIVQYIGTPEQVEAVVFWMMGNLGKSTWGMITTTSILLGICAPILYFKAVDINIIGSGDETATSLGIHVERARIICMVLAALITAGFTAFTGVIGFVGLIAPHITRMLIGGDNRYVLPGSALVGSIILLSADTAARTIISPIILPVGVMTAVLGVPFFLFLFLRQKKQFWY
ncbi:MAG TPA: iron ABC transporter permease [Methanospirillum sp.]|nr:iron ABC transporter permease [Methanospirillum sp.]